MPKVAMATIKHTHNLDRLAYGNEKIDMKEKITLKQLKTIN